MKKNIPNLEMPPDGTVLKTENKTFVWGAPPASQADWSTISNKPNVFPPSSHGHEIAEVNLLPDMLSALTLEKQDTLESGTNIKTVNDVSLLGSGNIAISGGSITSLNNTLTSGDVTMTNANQFYDGASITLTAGTWLVIGFITLGRAATTLIRYTARISDGTIHYASSQMTQPSQNPHYVNISMTTIITVNQNTIIKLQGAATSTNCLIKRVCADNASGNNATQINAIKLI